MVLSPHLIAIRRSNKGDAPHLSISYLILDKLGWRGFSQNPLIRPHGGQAEAVDFPRSSSPIEVPPGDPRSSQAIEVLGIRGFSRLLELKPLYLKGKRGGESAPPTPREEGKGLGP